MNSPFLALLLIANLLACPMRCVSCQANAVADEVCAPAACPCCSDAAEELVSQTPEQCPEQCPERGPEQCPEQCPEPCENDCNCQNCICEGAVVEADVELPDSVVQAERWVRPALTATTTAALSYETSWRRSCAPVGQLLCGRDVRVAHQSWLI